LKLLSIIIISIISMAIFCQEKKLTLSEIMFYPASGNNEFIEIYNLSGDSIDLTGYKIKYYSSPPDSLIHTGKGFILRPHSYAVIFEGDYDLTSGTYKSIISENALILKTEDNSFGSSGMSNSTSRNIILMNAADDTVDSYWYSADNNISISDEKIIAAEDNLNNWKNSITLNGTPGYKNSVTKNNYDLSISAINNYPSFITSNDQIRIYITILNNGLLTARNYSVSVFLDSNTDSLFSNSELIYNNEFDLLAHGDSIQIEIDAGLKPQNVYKVYAAVNFTPDQDSINNKKLFSFTVHPPPPKYNDIIINEIMYAPVSPEPEWIELYNRSAEIINLRMWKLSDNTTKVKVCSIDYYIFPGRYVVLSKDSSLLKKYPQIKNLIALNIPSLNNSGDMLTLHDSLNTCIDSLEYLPSWGGASGGRSIERISSEEFSGSEDNWGTCKKLGTPGEYNSISAKQDDLGISSIVLSNTYPIVGTPVKVCLTVKNLGTNTSGDYEIILSGKSAADDHYKMLTSFSGSRLASKDSVTFNFNYSDYDTGINFLSADLTADKDQESVNNSYNIKFTSVQLNETRGDLVINEIMYAPVSPEPEWIEIYNQSKKEISFKNYKLADRNDTVTINTRELKIMPGEYVIIAKDSSIISYYEIESEYITAGFPSLNNTGDRIILIDSLNRVIDSLEYISSWGGTAGHSLERIDPVNSSVQKDNWATSKKSPSPGRINTVSKLNINLAITQFSNDEYFISGDIPDFSLVIRNEGLNTVTNPKVLIYSDPERDSIIQNKIPLLVLELASIEPGDTTRITFSLINLPSGMNYLIAKLNSIGDQDSSNNIAFSKIKSIILNEEIHDLIINEVMYAPKSPEPEWIEIYNRSNKEIIFNNYSIKDNSSHMSIKGAALLQPDQYLIIAKDSSFYNYYDKDDLLIINTFPMLNNTFDSIILSDSLNRTIDSIRYNSIWGGSSGNSIERVNPGNYISDSLNWKQSLARATPGAINSVSIKKYNVGVSGFKFLPEHPVMGDNVSLTVQVKNYGLKSSNFKLFVYEKTNTDSVLLNEFNVSEIKSLDSTYIYCENILKKINKQHRYRIVISSEYDEDTSNNYVCTSISPVSVSSSVIINEIMYTPLNGEPEWIELYNNSGETVNLKGWSISDIFTSPVKRLITDNDYYIPAGKYIIITRDSSILDYYENIHGDILIVNLPVLNNTEDGVVIRDFAANSIDSILYHYTWGGQNGFSLERKSLADNKTKENWGSSISSERSTPGKLNSISEKEYDLKACSLNTSPLFPVSGENVSLSVQVTNAGKNPVDAFTVRFYYKKDLKDAYLFSGEVASEHLKSGDTLISANPELINIDSVLYCRAEISFLNDIDNSNNIAETKITAGYNSGAILINEIMYNPAESTPEWFELVNVSDKSVNLKNWYIGTSEKNIKCITDSTLLIAPYKYILIAGNHTGIITESAPVIRSTFSLSNTSGNIFIRDFRKALIDSVNYHSVWGNRQGVSLERLFFLEDSNDSSNWHLALALHGSTPGTENSVTNLQYYKAGDVLINEIMYDPGENNCEFVEFYNSGEKEVDLGGWTLTESSGNIYQVCNYHFLLFPDQYFILAADSSIIHNYPDVESIAISIIDKKDLGLNQEGERLFLKDICGVIIDSVHYLPIFHNKHIPVTKNRSLEKINSKANLNYNWSTSANKYGATPGFCNSVNTRNEVTGKNISVSPNPFSPDNDGYEDFAMINYSFDQPVSVIRIKVFDSQGRLWRTIIDNMISGSSGSILFDGLNEEGNALKIGIYIILLEGITFSNETLQNKTVVVIARKL